MRSGRFIMHHGRSSVNAAVRLATGQLLVYDGPHHRRGAATRHHRPARLGGNEMAVLARRWGRWLAALSLLLVVAGVCGWAWYYFTSGPEPQWKGHSEEDARWISTSLNWYADRHDGWYPTGQATPEAALGLLNPGVHRFRLPWALTGGRVPAESVQQTFDKGELLDAAACDWHYVEGLTQSDDARLAIAWEKDSHPQPGGGRWVVLAGRAFRLIRDDRWQAFLEEQEQLLGRRDELALTAGFVLTGEIRIPTGETVDRYDGPYELYEDCISEHITYQGRRMSGSGFVPLRWRSADLMPTSNGSRTWVLNLPKEGMRSKPVKFDMVNGRATPASIVFEMEGIR